MRSNVPKIYVKRDVDDSLLFLKLRAIVMTFSSRLRSLLEIHVDALLLESFSGTRLLEAAYKPGP